METAKFLRKHKIITSNWKVQNDGALFDKLGRRASDKSRSAKGYVVNGIGRHIVKRQVIVATTFVHNPRPDIFSIVDHINRVKTDNRAVNLRWVNSSLNQLNSRCRTQLTPHHIGKNPYKAQLMFLYRQHHLGYYATSAEAVRVMMDMRKQLFDRFYAYYTTQNDWLSPLDWRFAPGEISYKN
jgi:hypothetical protein